MKVPSTQSVSANALFITGANGFLGSEIVSQALDVGISVRATDQAPASKVVGVDYVSADILYPDSLAPHMRQVRIAIHVAGLAHVFKKTPNIIASFRVVNEIGTANVARVAAEVGVRHFVLISSVSVYGGSRNGGVEDAVCHPQGPYAESKYQAEQRAIEIGKQSGMAISILRLATLYGEGDPGNVARLMRKIDHGYFIWIGNGSNRKSLLHREDAARACLAVVSRPAASVNIYNVSASPCSMRDVVEGLAGALGKRTPRRGIPAPLARGISGLLSILPMRRLQSLGATVQKLLADDVYDGRKFARTFNFQVQVKLAEGLRREVGWYRREQAKRGT